MIVGNNYRWRPLACREKIPSLVDPAGYFYTFEHMVEFLANASLDEMELEFRGQIETVLAAGLQPTHLDWHSLRISGRMDIFELMFGLAREYGLDTPELLAMEPGSNHFRQTDYDFLTSHLTKEFVQAEGIILTDYRALQEAWR
jgi:predicted glycoside hydrolase/deacetylase ChbG (UPF0249 family)